MAIFDLLGGLFRNIIFAIAVRIGNQVHCGARQESCVYGDRQDKTKSETTGQDKGQTSMFGGGGLGFGQAPAFGQPALGFRAEPEIGTAVGADIYFSTEESRLESEKRDAREAALRAECLQRWVRVPLASLIRPLEIPMSAHDGLESSATDGAATAVASMPIPPILKRGVSKEFSASRRKAVDLAIPPRPSKSKSSDSVVSLAGIPGFMLKKARFVTKSQDAQILRAFVDANVARSETWWKRNDMMGTMPELPSLPDNPPVLQRALTDTLTQLGSVPSHTLERLGVQPGMIQIVNQHRRQSGEFDLVPSQQIQDQVQPTRSGKELWTKLSNVSFFAREVKKAGALSAGVTKFSPLADAITVAENADLVHAEEPTNGSARSGKNKGKFIRDSIDKKQRNLLMMALKADGSIVSTSGNAAEDNGFAQMEQKDLAANMTENFVMHLCEGDNVRVLLLPEAPESGGGKGDSDDEGDDEGDDKSGKSKSLLALQSNTKYYTNVTKSRATWVPVVINSVEREGGFSPSPNVKSVTFTCHCCHMLPPDCWLYDEHNPNQTVAYRSAEYFDPPFSVGARVAVAGYSSSTASAKKGSWKPVISRYAVRKPMAAAHGYFILPYAPGLEEVLCCYCYKAVEADRQS